MAQVGIGIIGCGGRARHVAKLLVDQTPGLEIVALCDPSADSVKAARASFAPEATVYDDHRALLADERVRWVIVGSWNCYHREHAVAALEAGKHVFCEKPLATTLEDALAIRDAHERSGQQFVIGFTLRYTPHYRRIHQLIEAGEVGQIISMEFNETLTFNHGGYIHQDWRRLTRNAGTHLLEKCCHDVDTTNWCVGSRARRVASFGGLDFFLPQNAHHAERVGPNPVNGMPAYQGWPRSPRTPFNADKDIIDNQVAIIEFDNGVRATFHTNCCAGINERRSYIVGTEGAIRADMITGKIELRRVGWQEPTRVYDSVAGGHGGGDEVMTRELGQCILEGTPPASTLQDGLAAAITCFAIDQAMETGQVVDVTPLWQQAGLEPAAEPQGVA